ncbi:TcfC E-set like domain-containing protein [Vibrio jasicida]|uniref:TcfC E-set like domain-containing protein n=1 Tax=Vibrio jasicida TaxID=766224 RepID=UPI004067D30B
MKYSLLFLFFFGQVQEANAIEDYPKGFQDYFVESEANVTVTLGDIKDSKSIPALVTYEQMRLIADDAGYREMSRYLTERRLKTSAIEQILGDLTKGVVTDNECHGRLSSCSVSVGELTKYVFDYDALVLRIILANNELDQTISDDDFVSPISKENGVVNWLNFYANSDFENHHYAALSNALIVGLPLGHINVESQVNTDGDAELYQALYRAELWGNNRFQIGRSRYNASFNATDTLNDYAQLSGESLYLSSSRNLFKGNARDYQRVYFFAPQAGQLEVYRGEQLLFNRLVSQGSQYISYAELPKGSYQLNLVLNVGGAVLVNETRQVVNNDNYALGEGEWDYALGLGQWDEVKSESEARYLRALTAYRWDDHWLTSAGITTNRDEQYYQLGAQYYFGEALEAHYNFGWFSNGGSFQSGRLSFAPLFVDYRFSKPSDSPQNFSQYLYGGSRYQDVGVGLSGPLFKGSGYLRLSWYETQSNFVSLTTSGDQYMAFGGWASPFLGGVFDLSLQYNRQADRDDNYSVMMAWSLPLGDKYTASTMLSVNQEGKVESHNTLSASHSQGNWSSYGSAGLQILSDRSLQAAVSGTLSGKTDWAKTNAYVYVNDRGIKTFSTSFSGTQAFAGGRVMLTPERGNAFIQVSTEANQDKNQKPLKSYVSYSDRLSQRFSLEGKEVVALNEFQTYQVKVDASGYPVELDNNERQGFVYPGTVVFMDANITPLSTMILILDDLEGQPIKEVQCRGVGCVDVEPISDDGIFRVSYRENMAFEVVSRHGMCVFEITSRAASAKGYCLPGIEFLHSNGNLNHSKKFVNFAQYFNSQVSSKWLFLGRFDKAKGIELIENINEGFSRFQHKIVGDYLYLYVREPDRLTPSQQKKLSEYQVIVLEEDYILDMSLLYLKSTPISKKESSR